MSSKTNYLSVQKTARILTEGQVLPGEEKMVWLIAHGYANLAPEFITRFSLLANSSHYLVVPEGLHRFYIDSFTGKVGASWMTKEERNRDIEDYCAYLDKVYETFIQPHLGKITVNALGFSQGGATICRWASRTKFPIHNLILWGTATPEDMNWEEDLEKLQRLNWIYVAGKRDRFLSEDQQKAQLNLLQKHAITPQTVIYDGLHDIVPEALELLTQKCVKQEV